MNTYSEKLKDPRWQKMRLKVMERDKFTCQRCFDTKNTLNVHHLFYKKNVAPWDYPEKSLITLCENCHKAEWESELEIESLSFKDFKQCCFPATVITDILPTFECMTYSPYNVYEVWEVISALFNSFSMGKTDLHQIRLIIAENIRMAKNG